MIPSPAGRPHASRPRRAPIIPAIPRSFEKKLKKEPRGQVGEGVACGPNATEQKANQLDDPSSETGQNLQIGISGDLNGEDGAVEISNSRVENHGKQEEPVSPSELLHPIAYQQPPPNTDGVSPGHPATDDLKENYWLGQHPPLYPKKTPPARISTDAVSKYSHGEVVQQAASTTAHFEIGSEYQQRLNADNHVRQAMSWTLPDNQYSYADTNSSPTNSVNQGNGLSEQPSFLAPHGPLDSLRYDEQESEHPPECQKTDSQDVTTRASSNVSSSPTRSIQGQPCGPQYDYQNQGPYNHRLPPQHDIDRSSYYYQPHQLPLVGNERPVTPSATPLAYASSQWDLNAPLQSKILPGHHRPAPLSFSDESDHFHHRANSGVNETHALATLPQLTNSQKGSSTIGLSEARISSFDASTINFSLASHVLENFNVGTFADCKLLATHEYGRFPPTRFLVHSLLLARSPRLRNMLANGHYSYDFDGSKSVHLGLCDRFITPVALEAALQICYGAPVASFTGSNAKIALPRTKAEFSAGWMKESLAFAAAGVLLQLNEVVLRGLEIAGKIINWENLELAISFALEGGRHRKHSPSASVIPNEFSRYTYDSDTSTVNTIMTPNTSQGSTDRSPDSKGATSESPPTSVQSASSVTSADDLLFRCLHFLASHLPHSWKFDDAALPLPQVDRLPATGEGRSPLAKLKLSRIQFGDLPTEVATKAADRDNFISSIILSLPFSALKALVLMEGQVIKQQIHRIIEERERRRHIVIRSHSASPAQREAEKNYAWIEVGYEEYVDLVDGDPNVVRRPVGIHKGPVETAIQGHQDV
ncbi:MAG: hypothetical protein Q9163_004877 [Psora crenata]